MVSLTNEEEALIETLVECLAHAIVQHDEVDSTDLNKTLVQKFVYLGTQEYGLPVTYSWYLAGSFVESDTVSPTTLTTAFDELETPSEPSVPADEGMAENDPDREATDSLAETADEFDDAPADIQREFELEQETDPQIGTSEADKLESFEEDTFDVSETPSPDSLPSHPDIPVEACIAYFREQLDVYPLQPTDRFLQQFYSFHAPTEFEQLYVNCLHIRSSLRTLTSTVRALANGRTPSTGIEQIEADLNRHISRVHLELADNDQLRDLLPAVLRGTDLIEDAVMKLTQLPEAAFIDDHVAATERLQEFYFQWVWKYPALKISAVTASGPSADRITRSRNRTFESFESRLTEKSEQVAAELDEAGLIPEYEDYPEFEQTATNEAIVDFTSEYIDE